MSLATVLQGSVALAGVIVDSLRVDVRHERWTGQDGLGVAVYAPAVIRRGLVEPTQRRVVALDGRELVATSHIMFFDAPPVSPKDRLTFADGTQPPVLAVAAPPLTDTGAALLWDVYLGAA